MKKLLLLLCMIFAMTILSSCYSESDVARAKREGYEEGYDLAKYEAKGEIERVRLEEVDHAYEAGYEAGYEDGYYDGLEEQNPNQDHGYGIIEKDK